MRRTATHLAAVLIITSTATIAPASPALAIDDHPDLTWRTDGIVFAVERIGDRVYLGGDFTQLESSTGSESVSRQNLAALDARTGAPIWDFDPSPNQRVYDIEPSADGRTLYIGGRFTRVNGVSRPRVAAVDAISGAVRTAFRTTPDAPVRALSLHDAGLYLGGGFSKVDGVPRTYIARVDATSGALDSFSASPNGIVRSIDVSPDGTTVYLAGEFTSVAGASRTHGLAGVRASSGDVVWRPDARRLGFDVEATADRVYSAQGGAGGRARAYRAFDATNLWSQGANGNVQTVALWGEMVLFGGHFRPSDKEGPAFAGEDINRMLAMVRASDGALVRDFTPQYCCFPGVWDIAADPNGIHTGGAFKRVNDWVDRGGYAQFTEGSDGAVAEDDSAPSVPEGLSVTGVTSSSVSLAWDASTDDVGVAGYRVYRDGTMVAEVVDTTYADTELAADTAYVYEVTAYDAAGNESARSASVTATTAEQQTTADPSVLVAAGATWRHLATGADPGSTWMQPAFDDASWPAAPAEFGFGDGDEVTEVPSGHRVYYFRRGFEVADPAEVSGLTVRLLRDDGAAVYVNGVEVVRDNLPDGELTNDTNALDAQWGSAESSFHEFTVPPSALVPGANLVAVSVHNKWYGDPDVSFDLALQAQLG